VDRLEGRTQVKHLHIEHVPGELGAGNALRQIARQLAGALEHLAIGAEPVELPGVLEQIGGVPTQRVEVSYIPQ
jgi:hypothetical protein